MQAPSFFVAGWAMSGESRSAEILGAHKILTELLCRALFVQFYSPHSLAPTRSAEAKWGDFMRGQCDEYVGAMRRKMAIFH